MTFTVLYRVFVAAKKYPSTSKERALTRNITRFQNAYFSDSYRNKISHLSPLSDIRLCPFDPFFKTNSQYICYKYEKCCQQGCCFTLDRYTQSWYFWLLVAAILLTFYLGSWYCKKMRMRPKRMRLQSTNGPNTSSSSNSSSPRVSPRRMSNEENVNHLLDYFVSSCRHQTINEVRPRVSPNSEPPPKYQEALNMPKLVRDNVQIAQIHTNGDPSTDQNQNVERPNENLPTYEDAVQISKQNENESA